MSQPLLSMHPTVMPCNDRASHRNGRHPIGVRFPVGAGNDAHCHCRRARQSPRPSVGAKGDVLYVLLGDYPAEGFWRVRLR